MPKPCHRRLSLRCLPPSRHLPTGRARSWLGHRPRYARHLCPAHTCRHARHNRSCTSSTPPLASALERNLPTGPARSWLGHRPRRPRRLRPAGTSRQALHDPHWGTVRAVLSVTAQPALAETVGTLVPGTRSASSSASPPSRHLPTGPTRSWLGHHPRHAQRYRPAETYRDGRHTRPGTRSASSSASPPSRHLPTGPARSSLGHRSRCAQRYRPADTCRDSRHTRSR
jgi:hypothetical protein